MIYVLSRGKGSVMMIVWKSVQMPANCLYSQRLLKEAERVLKPKGIVVIIPLYLSEVHYIFKDPNSSSF
ncbi:MAG: hypothetical protein QME40_07005 [bacterium]|nr:hypothetical protein [bacterium]